MKTFKCVGCGEEKSVRGKGERLNYLKCSCNRIMKPLKSKADGGATVPCSDGLVAELEDVIRLIESDTLITACSCYSDKTNGSTSAFFALDKVKLKVGKIIDEISN